MKKISRRRKGFYTFVITSLGFMSGLVLVVTLLTLGYFREAGADPSLFLSIGSVGVVVSALGFWRLKKLEVIDDSKDTE